MKKNLIPVFFVALLASCSEDVQHKCIAPLPAPYSLEALTDATVPASFSNEDFSWTDSNLIFTVYSRDIYDAVEISQMSIGDTLIFDGNFIVVNDILQENDYITVNGGVEEGGAWLRASDGGTYVAALFDDHATYTCLGRVTLPLGNDFMIIDCGDEPHEPSDTITSGHKPYMEAKAGVRDFCMLNTRLRIENGIVTCITRHWIP